VFGFSLLVFAAAYRWKDDRKTALEAAGLAGIVVATLLVCLSPNIVHRLQFGTNLEVAKRDAVESEVYALRGTLLTIPFPEHRIPAFARAGERFHGRAPFVNENRTSWLGTFGAIGFALSILAALGLAFRGEAGAAIRRASRANLFLFLLGTMGGIGALFNYLVWPQIRAYNRVSVFIAFLSLLVLAMAIFSRWEGAARTRGAWPWIVGAVMSLVVAADLVWTPSPGQWVQANRPRYLAHQAFAQGLEKDLPPAAMVFQLPHQRFPEGPAVHRAGSHDGFYPYLHTSALRFSYGAMKSRPEADWQDRIALRPPAELAAALQEYGFAAILLDRRGYPDRGLAIRSELVSKGWGVMRESEDYIAFRLSPPAVPRQAVLDSFQLRPVSGFHGAERWGEATGYWCEESCVLELDRARWPRGGEPVARPSVVEFSIAAYGTRTVTMSVDGELSTVLSPGQAESVVRLNVSPALDKVVLKFGTDTPGAVPAGDPRKLAYRVYDLRVR
jgi:phosphoglycerol transferase